MTKKDQTTGKKNRTDAADWQVKAAELRAAIVTGRLERMTKKGQDAHFLTKKRHELARILTAIRKEELTKGAA